MTGRGKRRTRGSFCFLGVRKYDGRAVPEVPRALETRGGGRETTCFCFVVFQSILYDELTRFVLRLTFSEVISKVIYKDGCFLT